MWEYPFGTLAALASPRPRDHPRKGPAMKISTRLEISIYSRTECRLDIDMDLSVLYVGLSLIHI